MQIASLQSAVHQQQVPADSHTTILYQGLLRSRLEVRPTAANSRANAKEVDILCSTNCNMTADDKDNAAMQEATQVENTQGFGSTNNVVANTVRAHRIRRG